MDEPGGRTSREEPTVAIIERMTGCRKGCMKGRMLSAALGLAAFAAGAQELQPAATEPALPRYRVEVIVFAHTDANPAEELFEYEQQAREAAQAPQGLEELRAPGVRIDPRRLGLPGGGRNPAGQRPRFGDDATITVPGPIELDPLDDFTRTPAERADPFETLDPFGTGARTGAGERQFFFRLLRPDELQLNGEYRRMERLGAYRTLGHGGWEQEGFDENASKPMNLAYLGMTNPVGTVRLWVSRFLHISVDLEYQAQRPLVGSDGSALGSFGLGQLATRSHYDFHMQHNAFRSGELQYIDHPMFGILVLVTPAPEAPEEIEDDTSVLIPAA
jgi:Peptidoglycan-binding protein, CsiV